MAEKVDIMQTAKEFFLDRASSCSAKDLKAILTRTPDVEPDEKDRL